MIFLRKAENDYEQCVACGCVNNELIEINYTRDTRPDAAFRSGSLLVFCEPCRQLLSSPIKQRKLKKRSK